MSLPKNFQQTTNLNNRVDSLTQINFYHFKCDLTLRNDVDDKELDLLFGHSYERNEKDIKLNKKISAINKDKSYEKINEWLGSLYEQKFITHYKIELLSEKSFEETVVNSGLMDIIL